MTRRRSSALRPRPLLAAIALCALAAVTAQMQQAGAPYDLVLAGGRVMDPASGLDAIRHVGIRGSQIAAVSASPLAGKSTVDVSGLVVAPGFIDPHSHAQSLEGNQFQARDGVTTALELESGAMPIGDWYRSREGQALQHYGATIGHIYSRIAVMHEKSTWDEIRTTRLDASQAKGDWAFRKAAPAEVDAMIARATYEKPAQFSEGIRHVLVGGTFIVKDEQLVPNVTPGRPIRNAGY